MYAGLVLGIGVAAAGIYARLRKEWLLRGWTDVPWALVNWTDGVQLELSKKAFYVAESCDGQTDFNSLAFLPIHRAWLDKLIVEGIAEPCRKQEGIQYQQVYRRAENPRLTGLLWSITGLCNLRCRHCFMEAPSGRYGQFSAEDISRLLAQFEQANLLEVSLTGGEPMLREDFLAIVGALAERRISLSRIYSNGLLITDDVLLGIKKVGFLPTFIISFDGCGGHDYMRGKKGIETQVLAAVRKLRSAQFPVVIVTCVDAVNIGRLAATYGLLKGLDIQFWHISAPQKTGNWRESTTAVCLDREVDEYAPVLSRWLEDGRPFGIQLGGIFNWQEQNGRVRYYEPRQRYSLESYDCKACREMPYLLPDGTLLPCPGYVDTIWQSRMPNILTENLSNVWSESLLRRIADMRKSDLLKRNEECRECDMFESCGCGCRSSALIATGDLMAKDPVRCEICKKGYRNHFRTLASVDNR